MKKYLIETKTLILMISLWIISTSSLNAQCVGGKLRVDTLACKFGFATLKVVGATSTGVTYAWQLSNDGGLSFNTMSTNSGKDTQNINVSLLARQYRLRVTCPTGIAYSDTSFIFYQTREIVYGTKFCADSVGKNDSLMIRAARILPIHIDTNWSRNFMWQMSPNGGATWGNLTSKLDSVKIRFTSAVNSYRCFVSVCPLTNVPLANLPTTFPQRITNNGGSEAMISYGLKQLSIGITNRDCNNDTATLGLMNYQLPVKYNDLVKVKWYTSTSYTGPWTQIGAMDSIVKVKVDSINRFYRASISLCNPSLSKDTVLSPVYSMWVDQGPLVATYNCSTERVEIDYQYRDSVRKSFTTYWTRSTNDSTSHSIYSIPVDSIKFDDLLQNKTDFYYKIYTKFCPTSPKILDSSYNLRVYLNIDSGNLKANSFACPNDTIEMKLLNYNAASSFPLFKKWQVKWEGSLFWEDYTQTPLNDTIIKFRMKNGLNQYRKISTFCTGKYAKEIASSVASTFLPFQLVDTVHCTNNMTVRMLNDTVKIKDYTGTTIKTGSFTYQWYKSTNKIALTLVAGATGPFLTITQADKNSFFKRVMKFCTTSPEDTSGWSNQLFPSGPNASDGRAAVLGIVCLNNTVDVGVVANRIVTGNTAFYLWQYSADANTWFNILSPSSNEATIKVLVGPTYKYFRRLTYWCPSGIIDSSKSVPVVYIKTLPWCEGFTSQAILGKDIMYNCWAKSIPVCSSYAPSWSGQVWSQGNAGKTGTGYRNWGPPASDPKMPPGRNLDLKIVTPAFDLQRGKVYRFSFFNQQDASNICWDSVYVTWGRTEQPCELTNKFGTVLANTSFDQWNKFWSDFSPPDDGIYYFSINIRDKDATTGEFKIDDICLKEIESCVGKNPVKGATFAPSKIVDRSEEPSKANSYDKSNVTHQYCINDTIMLTYNETNFESNFDYYGMSYRFQKKREDADWKFTDTFFRDDTFYIKKIAGKDTQLTYDKLNCHLFNLNNYHVKNILVTDTNTWYKIVATCDLDGKEFHSDSLIINGTHHLPYCDDWESVGNINNPMSPWAAPFGMNVMPISNTLPSHRHQNCPTCWASYNQNRVAPADTSPLFSMTLPTNGRNAPGPGPNNPFFEPDAGWVGPDVIMNTAVAATGVNLNRKLIVMPAMRLFKGRGYRVSFRWTDNRKVAGSAQANYGTDIQDLDSLYLMAVKWTPSGLTNDSFKKSKIVGKPLLNLQSNLKENGPAKYRTFWADYSPPDTGTYYFGVAVVVGAANGNAYRYLMDYFCVDTLAVNNADSCSVQPKFINPLRVRVSPDAKTWLPGDTEINPKGQQWCVGNKVNLELDFGFGNANAWNYGWKMYWQRNTKQPPLTPNWTTFDSTNGIEYLLSYKYRDVRLLLCNQCGTKCDTVGPFGVQAPGGDLPWCEDLDNQIGFPPCWDFFSAPRVSVKDLENQFGQGARSGTNYLDHDYETAPNMGNPPIMTTQTHMPPGFSVVVGLKHRFSFWYRDNGYSQTIDSLKVGWDIGPNARTTTVINPARVLVNKVNNDIAKNFRTKPWRFYTTEFIPTIDTAYHIKVTSFNLSNKRNYRVMFDDHQMKLQQKFDAQVIAIDSPFVACDLKDSTTIKVSVMNIGDTTLVNIPIKVSVDGAPATTFIAPGPIAPNQVVNFLVPGINLSAPGNRNVTAWTEVVGDSAICFDKYTQIITHNDLFDPPVDTVDSLCICYDLKYVNNSPNGFTKWYRKLTDATPFQIGDTLRVSKLCKDTTFYRSNWNGEVCYTTPENFSFGIPQYSAASGGITFDNLSKDTLIIDSIMVYAQTVSAAPTITLSQYGTNISTQPFQISGLGKRFINVDFKIPPGTDYRLVYSGGAQLAFLPNFIYIGMGCPSFNLIINGDQSYVSYPALAGGSNFNYFFNMRIIKPGCESNLVPLSIKTVPSPVVNIKDTTRVCSSPVYQVCADAVPLDTSYKYQWHNGDSVKCIGAFATDSFRVTVTNSFGCFGTDTLNLTVDPSPDFDLPATDSFCKFTPHIIDTKLDSGSNVVAWSNTMNGVKITVLNPGQYIATAYNTVNFCTKTDTINIKRIELPSFSLGNDRVFCGASTNLLVPTLPSTGITYAWPAGGPSISASGTYVVVGTDNITKCKNTDTVKMTKVLNPVFKLKDTSVCASVITSIKVVGPAGNFYYTWSTTSTDKDIIVSTPGTYYLTVTDSIYGCQTVDSIKVDFLKEPVFDLGPDIVECSPLYVLKGPSDPSYIKYTWTTPRKNVISGTNKDLGGCDTSGYYVLEVFNGCYTKKDTIKLTLYENAPTALANLKDTFGCGQIALKATSSSQNVTSFNWSNGDKSNITLISKTGTYSVSLANICGSATKTVHVRIDTTPTADFLVQYPSCMAVSLTNLSTNGVAYLWNFGDGNSSTVENPLYTYAIEGGYLVTLKTANACGFATKSTALRYMKVNCNTSGIEAIDLASSNIYIYPNPAKNSTQILGVGLPNGEYKLEMRNLLGQTVMSRTEKIVNQTIESNLDLTKLANGEYLVTISSEKETVTKKLQVFK